MRYWFPHLRLYPCNGNPGVVFNCGMNAQLKRTPPHLSVAIVVGFAALGLVAPGWNRVQEACAAEAPGPPVLSNNEAPAVAVTNVSLTGIVEGGGRTRAYFQVVV